MNFNWSSGSIHVYTVFCLFCVVAPTLAPLVYEADRSTQVRLRDYVVSHVFTDLEEDEPEEEDGNYTVGCGFILFGITAKLNVKITYSLVKTVFKYSKI